MAFKFAARTILELGGELISSDAIAVYELIKNSIDAQSRDGVEIDFVITISHSDYLQMQSKIEEFANGEDFCDEDLELLKNEAKNIMLPGSLQTTRVKYLNLVTSASDLESFRKCFREAYFETNWIEFRDTGCGMSLKDLDEAFLVIGTPSRKRYIDRAISDAKKGVEVEAPYLGEKGVGRLSAMRLGSCLKVQTATAEDSHLNMLDIDWDKFSEDPEMMAEDIDVEPYVGPAKKNSEYHGTNLYISGLQGNWSPARIRDVAQTQFARLSDPFSRTKRRYRVAINFNGDRIEIPRIEEVLFDHAHAVCRGKYTIIDGRPRLEISMKYESENKQIISELPDIKSLTKDFYSEVSRSALNTVGPFNFELYWFNRKRFNEIDTTGLRNQIRDWQKLWAGIMLFRDNYRVFPYGEESDDWLGLDRRALAASGYKLNKAQFIGRVSITRLKNPFLIDQTNREGLKDCDEKAILVAIMKYTIQTELKSFIEDVDSAKRTESQDLDFSIAKKKVDSLESRAKKSISELKKRHKGDASTFTELNDIFQEMQHYFVLAKERAEQIEDERLRMIQLAGVGLMIEVVAHELARTTEHTLTLLDSAENKKLPNEVESLFGSLRYQMKTINKRLRILDPLSVSGRQRKEQFDFVAVLRESIDSRSAQFERHGIDVKIIIDEGKSKKVYVHAVRGMIVQIIENLLANSIYWLKIEKEDNIDFQPELNITLTSDPFVLRFTDNGPGVRTERKETIFKAFYSTKGASTRQGLGLFIARDCANYHNGKLYLSSEPTVHPARLNTFVLELPKEILK